MSEGISAAEWRAKKEDEIAAGKAAPTEGFQVTRPRYDISHAGPEFFAALSKAQSEGLAASKDSFNPFFRSKYADLGSVWDAIREPIIAKNGFSVLQFPSTVLDGKGGSVVTLDMVLAHTSGQYVTGSISAVPFREVKEKGRVPTDDAPGIGACNTYLRRILLGTIIGATAEDDDDGNAAAGRPQVQQQQYQPPQEPRRAATPAPARPAPPPTQATMQDKAQDNLRKLWAVAGKLNIKGKVKRDGGEVSSINVNEALWPIVEKIGCGYYGEKDGVGRYIVVRELEPDQIEKLANSLSAYLQELDAGEALEPKA